MAKQGNFMQSVIMYVNSEKLTKDFCSIVD